MKILIIDDDRTVCSSLKLLLGRNGFNVQAIHHPNEALETIESFGPSLILLDMNFTIDTSGKQGLKLLKTIRQHHSKISIILMTGWATVQLAVEGMKLGAKDFLAKPWDNKQLLNSIETIRTLHHETNNQALSSSGNSQIIGHSDRMSDVMRIVDKVAKTEASVLITGESGTGKELIAEAIHQKSHRFENPFVKVNLGGIPNQLFESEMFGHKKGAFTGADQDRDGRFRKAHTGTIFLDEIGELALESQVKMLRVLQERVYEKLGSSQSIKTDVRVISATNRQLDKMAVDGSFREDLFYRINLINIHLPPLRERRTDIPLLVKYFVNNVTHLYGIDGQYIDDDTMQWLSMQSYKGNIRQLKNVVERTVLLNLNRKDLTKKEFQPAFNNSEKPIGQTNMLNLQAMEIDTIRKALAKHGNSISASAKALGITRSSLYRRLEKYNITDEPQA